jgi:ABC-2 type transport system permease protein
MRMVLVELSRFRCRRAIALMLLAAALLTALIAATTVWDTRPVSAAELAQAQTSAEREASSPAFTRELRRCERHPEQYNGPGSTAGECAESMRPRAEWYLDRSPLSLERVRDDGGLGALLLVTGIMVIVGTTFAGADWASGSMSNQLLFEPRRGRVWLAKAAAIMVGAVAATAVIMAAFWAVLFLAAQLRGIATPASVQESIRALLGRGVLLAGFGALGAFALTMLLRNTVGTLAALFAYAVGGTAVIAALPLAGVGRWSVGNNVQAWLHNGYEYYDQSIRCGRDGSDVCDQTVRLSLGQGAGYLGVVLAAVVLASLLAFRRRDIP